MSKKQPGNDPANEPRQNDGAADSEPTPPPQRFIVSNLLSLHPAGQARADAIARFSERIDSVLLRSADIKSDSLRNARTDGERRVVVFEADPAEIAAKAQDLTGDTVIEPELPRVPAVARPAALFALTPPSVISPGTGATLALRVVGNGAAVAGATVIVRFSRLQNAAESVVAGGVSDAAGEVSVPFDSNQWRPTLAIVEPAGKFWSAVSNSPQSGQVITLQALPTGSPFGWWQLLTGLEKYDAERGKGINVGVIDTGIGPHPNLKHAVPVGAFIDGSVLLGAKEGQDVQTHGTHVSGIVGARSGGSDFAGIAPGAGLFVARVFPENASANQGDIANAIDELSVVHSADLINMSLVGAASAIEHDAVIVAFQRGTVCICSAGNQSGAPVGYPAAYPECIAVSALGLLGAAPIGSMPSLNIPAQFDRYGSGGLFLPTFSNIGPQILCTAPGNGIVSTVPTTRFDEAPYADMSGTSMSAPIVTGALACLLAGDTRYRSLERTATRALAARQILMQHATSIGLARSYQGAGVARAV